jgi:xylitol oxidase
VATATNWSGTYTYRARRVHEPATIDELQRIVASAEKIHALGSRHSFNDVADSAELVSLAGIDPDLRIDRETMTVTASGGIRYGDLAQALEREGLALHNMASLPHITVAGSVATATHGSGDRNGNLATTVVGLELVTSDGESVTAAHGDPDFPGMVVNLGALGVVTRITLRVEPTYLVRQQAFERLPWGEVERHFNDIMASATSVSLFTDYGESVNQVWLKHRVADGDNDQLPESFHGALAATVRTHPVATLSAESCTEQLGIPGAWLDRIPHFRMDFTPSAGAEIQSEYMVPREHAVAAIRAVRELGEIVRAPLMIAEVRTVSADDLWLSTAYRRDTVCLHFTWNPDAAAVERALPALEVALEPFEPRPHWGKLFLAAADELSPRYERMADFRALAERLDPRGAFRNAFLDRHVFG